MRLTHFEILETSEDWSMRIQNANFILFIRQVILEMIAGLAEWVSAAT